MSDKSELIDSLLSQCMHECRFLMREISTLDAITICYNLIAGKVRLCCLIEKKEDVIQIVKEIHEGLLEEIEDMYDI